jgi:hypothetical protein
LEKSNLSFLKKREEQGITTLVNFRDRCSITKLLLGKLRKLKNWKQKNRKLQGELWMALDKIEEMEMTINHLVKWLEKMKANWTVILAQQYPDLPLT